MGIEQANLQQAAVAANLAGAQTIEQLVKSEFETRTDQVTDNRPKPEVKAEESVLRNALNGKSAKAGNQILNELAAKLAGTLPSAKILQNLSQEFDFVIDAKKEDGGNDKVEISSQNYFISKPQKEKNSAGNGGGGGAGNGGDQNGAPKEAIKEYLGAYSQFLVNGGQEAKKKVENLENALLKEKGLSAKELQGVKVQTANSVRSEILRQVKSAYLKQLCAKSKSIEWAFAKKETQGFLDLIFFNDRTGGYDFGGLEENAQKAVNRATGEAAEETKDFVAEKLTEALVKKNQGGDEGQIKKDIDGLLKLGEKIGFDVQSFLRQVPKLNDDLGLLPALEFGGEPAAEAGMNGDAERRGQRYQYTAEEEKDLLTDKLRALFLLRAVNGDLRTVFETQFKMIKLRNGLIQLGASNFVDIEQEGRALARIRLFDMLREGFEERATYAKLSGSAWSITEKKIKTVLRNLEKIGVAVSQAELDEVRDKANDKMYREAEHELSLINAAIGVRGEIKFFTSRRQLLVEAMARIAGESGFSQPGTELGQVAEAV